MHAAPLDGLLHATLLLPIAGLCGGVPAFARPVDVVQWCRAHARPVRALRRARARKVSRAGRVGAARVLVISSRPLLVRQCNATHCRSSQWFRKSAGAAGCALVPLSLPQCSHDAIGIWIYAVRRTVASSDWRGVQSRCSIAQRSAVPLCAVRKRCAVHCSAVQCMRSHWTSLALQANLWTVLPTYLPSYLPTKQIRLLGCRGTDRPAVYLMCSYNGNPVGHPLACGALHLS
jgi:hypothetical protein